MNEWPDCGERRKMNLDHDTLIEIKSDVKAIRSTLNDQKEALVIHTLEDNKTFDRIRLAQEFTNKIIYGCIGVFLFVEIILKVLK